MKLSYIAVLGLALAGCGTLGGGGGGVQPMRFMCTGNCDVTVTVNGCGHNDISVDRDPIEFRTGVSGNITWTLSGDPKWQFLDNGIEFKSSSSASEFDNKDKQSRKFKWRNKHTVKQDHEYSIWVTPDGGRTKCKHHPTIVNH